MTRQKNDNLLYKLANSFREFTIFLNKIFLFPCMEFTNEFKQFSSHTTFCIVSLQSILYNLLITTKWQNYLSIHVRTMRSQTETTSARQAVCDSLGHLWIIRFVFRFSTSQIRCIIMSRFIENHYWENLTDHGTWCIISISNSPYDFLSWRVGPDLMHSFWNILSRRRQKWFFWN